MARPARPEPKFFLVDEIYARGFDYYVDTWFRDVNGRVAGEKSTNYLESAAAAQRIHQHLPDVKLVFILRDPAERAWSNWAWSRMNGMEREDFATAISLEQERERHVPAALRYARPHAYFSRGLYASLLRPYVERFSRDQILCLKFDDIVAQPCVLAARLHRFLGVAPRPTDATGLDVVNPSEKRGETMPAAMRALLHDRYLEAGRELTALLGPEFDWEAAWA